MNIFCRADDCRYMENGFCNRGDISISEDCECEDYESYLDTEEWKHPFWKRMLDNDNNITCRVQYFGKEIDIKGRKFFVESRSGYAILTDAITGMGAGTRDMAESRIARIIEAASKIEVQLEELPIATYDEINRVFSYIDEGGSE